MVFSYFLLMGVLLSITNMYVIWLLMELMFVIFLLYSLYSEDKNMGLIIHYFFQSFMSLTLFICMSFGFSMSVMWVLVAKLGLFPLSYWVIVVTSKVGYLSNMFILGLQKISVYRLYALTSESSVVTVYSIFYLSMIVVLLNLWLVSDLWLLLIYSSILNSALILMASFSSYFLEMVFLYVCVTLVIVYSFKHLSSHYELIFLIFLFLVVPPFFLFYLKLWLVLSLSFSYKMFLFIFIFDVFVLSYYFTLVFTKFMLSDLSLYIYFMNFLLMMGVIFPSNCVTLTHIYES